MPVYDPGPFQPEEGGAIAEAVEQFFQQLGEPSHDDQSDTQDYRLADAPPSLVRRFLLQRPGERDGESSIPWRKLPSELFHRVSAADGWKRQLYQAYTHRQGRQSELSVAEVMYARERENQRIVFDLSDVYLCLEADVLAAYEKRDHPDPRKLSSHPERTFTEEDFAMTRRVYRDSADWSRAVLNLVGQALMAETP